MEAETPLAVTMEPEAISILPVRNEVPLSFGKTRYEMREGLCCLGDQVYQIHLSMLCLLHGISGRNTDSIESFHLASNLTQAGAFGDLVYKYNAQSATKRSKIIFVQTRYEKDVGEEITMKTLLSEGKNDYNLENYFKSYQKIKAQFAAGKTDHPIFGGKFEDCEFIVFSNVPFRANLEEFADHVSKQDSEKDDIFNCLPRNHWYQLSFAGNKQEEILKFTINSEPSHKKEDLDDKEEIIEFFTKLRLFYGQPNEAELSEIIKRRIQEVLPVKQNKIDVVYATVQDKLKSWLTGGQARYEYLTEDNRFFQQSARVFIRFDVKEPVELFTGRGRELDEIRKSLRRANSSYTVISQAASVGDLGGIGKTELAREYIHANVRYYDGNVIWINAESEKSLEDSIRRLAQDELGIDTKDKNERLKDIDVIAAKVYSFFSGSKSIFVFDNLDSAEDVDQFLGLQSSRAEATRPHILITSRRRDWKDGADVVVLEGLTTTEAIRLVKRGLKISGEDETRDDKIKGLVEELRGFLLAIEQAIAYIWDQSINGTPDIDDYLKALKKTKKELVESELFLKITNDYDRIAYTTWRIAVERIKQLPIGETAWRILEIIAYLGSEDISDEIFRSIAQGDDSAISLLMKFSLLKINRRHRTFSVHRLVQRVTKLDEEQGEKRVIDKVFSLISRDAGEEEVGEKIRMLPHMESVLSHMDEWIRRNSHEEVTFQRDYVIPLLDLLNEGYSHSGNIKRSVEILERALELKEKCFGSEHLQLAATLSSLGSAYGKLGDLRRAQELLERALRIQGKHKDVGPSQFADTLVKLGNIFGRLGDPQTQMGLVELALGIQEKHHGSDHSIIVPTLLDLGVAYGMLGYPRKEKDTLERALKIQMSSYVDDHVELVPTLKALSSCYGQLGEPQTRKDLLERALRIEEEQYGRDHRKLASTFLSLGRCYGDLGDLRKRIDLLERALAIQEKHEDDDDPEVGATLANLGHAYGDTGDYEKMKELLIRALSIVERHYSEDHLVVADVLSSLSGCYVKLGDPRRGKELLERSLCIAEKHYSAEDFRDGRTLAKIGQKYGELGRRQKQKEVLERALRLVEEQYGSSHYIFAETMLHLANCHGHLGDSEKWKELAERALEIEEKHYGADHFRSANTLMSLGTAHGHLGNHEKCNELLKRALNAKEKHYGVDNFEILEALAILARSYDQLGDLKKQKELLERSLVIEEKHYGVEHVEITDTLTNLGNAYRRVGNHEKCIEILERTLRIKEKYYGANDFEVVGALSVLARSYGQLKDYEKEKDLLERVLAIVRVHYGPDHFVPAAIVLRLSNCQGHLGDDGKKKELYDQAIGMLERNAESCSTVDQFPEWLSDDNVTFEVLQKGKSLECSAETKSVKIQHDET